jgi:hypothetical protein
LLRIHTDFHKISTPRPPNQAASIVEAVLDGRQAPEMTLPALMRAFPVEWAEQRAGFSSQA